MLMVRESDQGGRTHGDEVGDLLIKVQSDLRNLKVRLSETECSRAEKALLEDALCKTESTIMKHTEDVMQNISNNVTILPTVPRSPSDGTLGVEQYGSGQVSSTYRLGLKKSHGSLDAAPSYDTNVRRVPLKQPMQTLGLTPGQLTREIYNLRILANPSHPKNREYLNENYDIQLPMIHQRQAVAPLNRTVYGSTYDHLTVLPKENRVDPSLEPPPIQEKDTKHGIMSLLQRGLIPYTADLSLNPPPVRHKSAKIHDAMDRDRDRTRTAICEAGGNLAAYKLDVASTGQDDDDTNSIIRMPVVPLRYSSSSDTRPPSAKSKSSVKTSSYSAPMKLYEMTLEATTEIDPPTTPASIDSRRKAKTTVSRQFAIQKGCIRDDTKEFRAVREKYCLTWGCISTVLKRCEDLMRKYKVPLAFIDGDKLSDLAVEHELDKPTQEELLSIVINRDVVEQIINTPGRVFMSDNGDYLAASKIQATWKGWTQHKKYTDYRRKKWAAGVIAISWVMNIKLAQVRRHLKQARNDHIILHKNRLLNLSRSWTRIQNSRRVIIHIPSLGMSQQIRSNIRNINLQQNLQMSRLCDISDPNVDIIYISPVNMNDELVQYYEKLMGLLPAVDSGDVETQSDQTNRFRIIVPEAVNSFPTHSMSLSTILKYSPKTLKRIHNLIKGRNSYIMTGVPHKDDLYISDFLDTPVICPEPEVAQLYSTKSGSKRVFASAGVDVPPGEYDVYSLQQLHECLSQLVTDNLDVQRWLFKLDDEFDGRGIAYCDIPSFLRCYNWAAKEARRYGDKWSKKWAQDAAFIKICMEIPDILNNHATPVNQTVYPTWAKFLEAFLSQGGVVEAVPPSPDMTAVTVDMFIAPNGEISLVCCGDQIHADSPFTVWGLSVPQSSVEPNLLNEKCTKVAEACRTRGIVGYFAIDFVTFIDLKTNKQQLWATDLSIQYSDSVAMFSLLKFTTKGSLNPVDHILAVKLPGDDIKSNETRTFTLNTGSLVSVYGHESRYAVMSTRLHHSNLAVIHYSVFFQMCRAHGIGYDLKEKQGTVFTLVDGLSRENLGMLSIGESLQQTLAMCGRNLQVIHNEISAPNMQGITNFKDAIADIENILGCTQENAKEIEDNLTAARIESSKT